MSDAVLVALITGVCAVLSNLLITRSGRIKDAVDRAERDKEFKMRLESIEKKVDEHNGYAKRFEAIGKDITEIRTVLEFLKNK